MKSLLSLIVFAILTLTGFHVGFANDGMPKACQSFTTVKVKTFFAHTKPVCVNDRDEIWTIDLRNAHCANNCDVEPNVTNLVGGKWTESSLTSLIDSHVNDQTRKTILYLHGNRTNSDWAETRGVQTYSKLFNGCQCRPAVRMVLIKWRSDPELKTLKHDYVVKSRRSVILGPAFRQLLDKFGDQKPMLVGYSLGAQIILSALNTQSADSVEEVGKEFQVVFIAPAIDADFAACNSENVQTLSGVSQSYVFTNSKDYAIKFSNLYCDRQNERLCQRERILNGTGLVNLGTVSRFDISNELGHLHSVVKYAESPTLVRVMNQLIMR